MDVKKTRTILQESLKFDKVKFSKKKNTWSVKKFYFYTLGKTPEQLAEEVKKLFPEAIMKRTTDEYNTWPKDSYFLVEFKFPEAVKLQVGDEIEDTMQDSGWDNYGHVVQVNPDGTYDVKHKNGVIYHGVSPERLRKLDKSKELTA